MEVYAYDADGVAPRYGVCWHEPACGGFETERGQQIHELRTLLSTNRYTFAQRQYIKREIARLGMALA